MKAALVWLKANNRLYENITISEENLGQLPVDGVPEELLLSAKYTTDIDLVCEEKDGYVPKNHCDAQCTVPMITAHLNDLIDIMYVTAFADEACTNVTQDMDDNEESNAPEIGNHLQSSGW